MPVLLASVAILAAAGTVPELLSGLSLALQDGNAARFLVHVDRARFREYAALENKVVALLAQYEVGSSVELLEQVEDRDGRELKLDWILRLRPASGEGPAVERRRQVRCRLEPRGKIWKVTALEPMGFFGP